MKSTETNMIEERGGIITVIDGPTWVENMEGLLARYAKNVKQKKSPYPEINDSITIVNLHEALQKCAEVCRVIICQGVEFDLTKINDMRYFVNKAFQLINKQSPSGDFQTRMLLLGWLENFFGTEFKSTKDFRQKIRSYLQDYDARKLPVSKRLKKARKKLRWTQSALAKRLGYTNHVSIAQFETGKRYPSKRVFQWLKEVGM